MEELCEVDIEKIVVNPLQPRREFALEGLTELSASILAVGLIHPPVVRRIRESNTLELVAGERRLRAVQMLGWKKMSVCIRDGDRKNSGELALIENVQRVDLNPIEVAQALRGLIDQFHYIQEELADKIGKKRSTVANYLRLLSLPLAMQQSVLKGNLTMGHAKVVLSLEGEEAQQLLHDMIVKEQLTVRQAEEQALKLSTKPKKAQSAAPAQQDIHLERVEEQLRERLGTKVAIQSQGKKGGRVSIDYYSLDDLQRLLDLLGISCEAV